MEFETLVQTRKSVRGFKKQPVSRATIEEIIEVAKRAPSSMNTQPWHVHVLTGAPLEEVRRRTMEEMVAGAKAKRYSLPNARVMIHPPGGGTQGTARDMEIQVEEILKMKKRLEEILGTHTGRSAEEVAKATDRDNFLSPEAAKDFGLIDHIVSSLDENG